MTEFNASRNCCCNLTGENSVSYACRIRPASSSCNAVSLFKCEIADSSARGSGSVTQSAAPLFFAHCTTSDVSGAQITTGRPAREYSVSFVAKHVSVRRRCTASKNMTTKYAWNEPSHSSKAAPASMKSSGSAWARSLRCRSSRRYCGVAPALSGAVLVSLR